MNSPELLNLAKLVQENQELRTRNIREAKVYEALLVLAITRSIPEGEGGVFYYCKEDIKETLANYTLRTTDHDGGYVGISVVKLQQEVKVMQ